MKHTELIMIGLMALLCLTVLLFIYIISFDGEAISTGEMSICRQRSQDEQQMRECLEAAGEN